uniref:LysR substrate-binding domain-containing protein n=1 Tax=Pseudomonas sp. EMN2 TaxID=2615212 RepID=UPI002113A52D
PSPKRRELYVKSGLQRRWRHFKGFHTEPNIAGLDTEEAFVEELALIVAKNSTVSNARDLEGSTIIAFASGCSYRRILEGWLNTCEIVPSKFLELASYHAIAACVAAGTGVAIMPLSVLKAVQIESLVRALPLPPKVARVRTHLIWRCGHDSSMLQSFLSEISRPRGSTSS